MIKKIKDYKKFKVFFNYHFFFLFLFTGYIISLILFNDLTLFYIDRLDNEIVLNHILGNFYRGETDAAKVFLNGETKIYWIRRILQPYSLIYIFDTKTAYWIIDLLTKIISYFSFYILAKKISKNYFIISLSSCFFASLNIFSLWGFLITTFPYFVYLITFKQKLKFKHYLITLCVALNSELVHAVYFSIIILIFLIAYNSLNKNKLKNLVIISIIFYIFVLIANLNIIYAYIFDGPFHREEIEFIKNGFNLKKIILEIFYLGYLTNENFFSYSLALNLPKTLYAIVFFPLIFFLKNYKLNLLIVYFVLIGPIFSFIFLEYIHLEIKKYWNPGYYNVYLIFIYSLIFFFVVSKYKKLIYLSVFILILFQTNSSWVPFAKKYLHPFKVENYRNYYTFDGYYLKKSYETIKKVVGDKKVISLWPLDPMVAAMNGINTLDGEHNLYLLSYKKKFYKIIKNELNSNPKFYDYYLKWGHRVYAFVSDTNNVKIDFQEAKNQGAEFVITKFLIENNNLKKILEIKNTEILYLYKII